MIVQRHTGPFPQVWSRHIKAHYHPMLMLVKPPIKAKPTNGWISDLITGGRDKEHHAWGQGPDVFKYFIERLTEPGGLVVDPFCGGGTVPEACIMTGRRYIAT